MQPEQLYNQLRFNLQHPYDINKLSVRHKNPRPITIEKAGDVGATPLTSKQPGEDINVKFSSLNLERLKEAQFLAQRQLKKQKDKTLVSLL